MDYDNALITLETLIDDLTTHRNEMVALRATRSHDDDGIDLAERAQDIIGWVHWE